MALFGRDSQADLQRIERVKHWTAARSPYALISLGAGLFAVVDFITLVLGIGGGLAAIAFGWRGLRDLRQHPHLLGRKLCIAGITLGIIGIVLSVAMWAWVYPSLRRT